MTRTNVAAAADVGSVTRSLTVDMFVEDNLRQPVLNDIRRYRACCRQCYAIVVLAQTAGSRIESDEDVLRIIPETDRAKIIALAALDRREIESGERVRGKGQTHKISGGSGFAYELRDYVLRELWPDALSYVWDSIRRDVTTIWTSKDPEFARAQRGWLALQGARGIAQFNWRGIGCPRATARPKLSGHELTLKWSHERGSVAFALPRMDYGRYHVWKALRDETAGWSLGTLFLNERDGKLRATISYTRPAFETIVDPERICRVRIGEPGESFIVIQGADGAVSHDAISGEEVVAWLRRTEARKTALERRRAACGNPRRPWGHRHGWLASQDVLSRATEQRSRGVADRNHAWTRRIVTRALSWRCGRIIVEGIPEGEPRLAGHPWRWREWHDFLTYKSAEHGIAVETAQ